MRSRYRFCPRISVPSFLRRFKYFCQFRSFYCALSSNTLGLSVLWRYESLPINHTLFLLLNLPLRHFLFPLLLLNSPPLSFRKPSSLYLLYPRYKHSPPKRHLKVCILLNKSFPLILDPILYNRLSKLICVSRLYLCNWPPLRPEYILSLRCWFC